MLASLALVFLFAITLGSLFTKLKLPSLLGMLLSGIILGPNVLNWLHPTLLEISPDLQELGLIVVLIHAGLALDIRDLKKVGRQAILMCFVPAIFEIVGAMILAPLILGVSLLDAAIIGAILAAVSPAIIVPRMVKVINQGYGTDKSIPQIIIAGASVDDVFVIVLFTSFMTLAKTNEFNVLSFLEIPLAILSGVAIGIIFGLGLIKIFKSFHIRDSIKVLIILGLSFLLVDFEARFNHIPFSGLLSVMTLGIVIYQKNRQVADRLTDKFEHLWVAAEIILFVLVGTMVDISYIGTIGLLSIVVILGALLFRSIGVYLSMSAPNINKKEKLFTIIANTPKATVQAAIGGLALTAGLPAGETILIVSIMSILVTAPLGAIGIDLTYKRLLQQNPDKKKSSK